TWPKRRLDRANVLAIHGRSRSNRTNFERQGYGIRTGRGLRKNFRPDETGERVALERALRLFLATGSESETGRAIGSRPGSGAQNIHDGEHGSRTTRLSLFPKVRPANQRRKHARMCASADRDCADPNYSRALFLWVSQ